MCVFPRFCAKADPNMPSSHVQASEFYGVLGLPVPSISEDAGFPCVASVL